MLVEVIMYGENDEQVAKSLVEADTLNDAHKIAIRLIKKQYPDIDPQSYNQTIASKIYFRSSSD
jgi:hypothetical protein